MDGTSIAVIVGMATFAAFLVGYALGQHRATKDFIEALDDRYHSEMEKIQNSIKRSDKE